MMYLTRISIEPIEIDDCGSTLDRECGAEPLMMMPMF